MVGKIKLDPLPQKIKDDIKSICHQAVKITINEDLQTGGDEDNITSSLITQLRQSFNQLMDKFDDSENSYKMNLKSVKFRRKVEKEVGADILLIQHRYWGTQQRRKYLLIQAKKMETYEPGQDLDNIVNLDQKLTSQINQMRESTNQNFVLIYTNEGFFIKSGNNLIEGIPSDWLQFCEFYLDYTLCGYGQKLNAFQDPLYDEAIELSDPQWALIQVLRSIKKKQGKR